MGLLREYAEVECGYREVLLAMGGEAATSDIAPVRNSAEVTLSFNGGPVLLDLNPVSE